MQADQGDERMPHVVVKLWPGESEANKLKLTNEITKGVESAFGYGPESVSVAFEEISSTNWAEQVYRPEILPNLDKLYKKPGYSM